MGQGEVMAELQIGLRVSIHAPRGRGGCRRMPA